MMERDSAPSEVYVLNETSDTVQGAKSQFSDDYDAPYDELHAKVVKRNVNGGYRNRYPKHCVVVWIPDGEIDDGARHLHGYEVHDDA